MFGNESIESQVRFFFLLLHFEKYSYRCLEFDRWKRALSVTLFIDAIYLKKKMII